MNAPLQGLAGVLRVFSALSLAGVVVTVGPTPPGVTPTARSNAPATFAGENRPGLCAPVDYDFGAGAPPVVTIRDRGLDESGPSAARSFHEFYFTRGMYSSGGGRGGFFGRGGGGGGWTTDYPKADRQFTTVIERLGKLDLCDWEHPVSLDSPQLRFYPYVYILEVGRMNMTEEEVTNLRGYLLAGGLLIVDDFWGLDEWYNFEEEIKRVLPEYQIKEIPLDDLVFRIFYRIDEVRQTPNIGNARNVSAGFAGARTWEDPSDTQPHVRGIYDDKGRLMVIINYNTDLGDAWEWAEDPGYPTRMSTYAMEMGLNMIIYSMIH